MNNNNNIKEQLKGENYNFLRENKYLGKNIALLALGGSRAYGTDLPTSDIDIRGMALNPSKQMFNLEPDFGQVDGTDHEKDTDVVIYSLNKMNKLLLSCNPNTIEILGCRPEDYIYINKYGQMMLDNSKNYLSIKAIDSFGGYANQQYNRLEHGLLGNGENDDKKLKMLKHSLERSIGSFESMHKGMRMQLKIDRLSTEELKELYPNRSIDSEVSNEHLVVSGNIDRVPVTDFKGTISYIHKVQSEYGNINKRNTKKTDEKLAKHMMHLIRLYYMGTDLNAKGEINTYQSGKRHEILMSIRNEEYMHQDGKKVLPEFYELLHEVQSEYDYSLKNTVLPEKPNYDAINEMMLAIYKDAYSIGDV